SAGGQRGQDGASGAGLIPGQIDPGQAEQGFDARAGGGGEEAGGRAAQGAEGGRAQHQPANAGRQRLPQGGASQPAEASQGGHGAWPANSPWSACSNERGAWPGGWVSPARGPTWASRPATRTPTRSASGSTSARTWETKRTVPPRRRTSAT